MLTAEKQEKEKKNVFKDKLSWVTKSEKKKELVALRDFILRIEKKNWVMESGYVREFW